MSTFVRWARIAFFAACSQARTTSAWLRPLAAVAAAFQHGHGHGEEDEGDQEGAALLEIHRDGAGGEGGGEAAVEARRAPPHHQTHEPAEDDE